VIWSTSRALPSTMPTHTSWDEPVKQAKAVIDHIPDGSPRSKL
jgi:hypothetical protein